MKQSVEIVWMKRGRFTKEQCFLLDDDTPAVDAEGHVLTEFEVEEHRRDGYVLFEDAEGQFWLHSSQIHSLKIL